MRYSLKHGRSSSSLDCFHPYLKKQKVEMLRFCSTFTSSSSVISGTQTRVSPLNSKLETTSLTKTSKVDRLIENQHCRVRRSCSDYDDDKSVSSPAQSDITEQQRSNWGSGSGSDDVSESKSVRVERLKKRFSRIIVKSAQLQEKVDRSNDLKFDKSAKMQVDKQILIEKKRLKEAQIAADTAKMQVEKRILIEKKKIKEAQIAAEAESKREIQRKREAARKVLLELERTVEVDDNIKTMKDFAVLLGYPRNSAVCHRNEIGWYGEWVVYWKKTKDEGGLFEELFKERVRRMRLKCLNMYG